MSNDAMRIKDLNILKAKLKNMSITAKKRREHE